jgi:MATE family multidrug resistance protein
MRFTEYFAAHARRIAALAWPLLIGQLAVIANGVIDTAMTSRYSSDDLAALAIGASVYVSIFVGLNGVLQALSPLLAQLYGAKKFKAMGEEVRQGAWLALILTIAGCLLLLNPGFLLGIARVSGPIQDKVHSYLQVLALALPATMAFRVYSSLNTALARPKMVMFLQVAGLALKVPLNMLFIFGGLGLPAFGGPGCAMATASIAWIIALAGWILVARSPYYGQFHLFDCGISAPRWPAQKSLLKLGIPMGLSYLIEVTAFTFMALFIARLGPLPVSGHQITANLGTVLYMLPLSIANATGTLVAQAIGAQKHEEARRAGLSGIALAAGLSSLIGIAVWLLREPIIHAYTPDARVFAAALPLFIFIGFYQLGDSVQVTTAFVLRAYRVAVVPTIMYAVSLWGLGLGGGYLLGLDPLGISPTALHGPAGFWLGNSLSLAVVAAGLLWYLHRVQKRSLREATAA